MVRVDVPYAQPPLAVLPSYNAVKNAEKTKNEIINKAQAEATRVTNEAQGTVDKVLQEATAFKNETVAAARGEGSALRRFSRPTKKHRMSRFSVCTWTPCRMF